MFAEWNDHALATVEQQPDVPLARGNTHTKLLPRLWEWSIVRPVCLLLLKLGWMIMGIITNWLMALGHLSILIETKLIWGKNREVVCVFMSTKSGATQSLFAKHFACLTLSCCQSHSTHSTFPGNSPSFFSRLCTVIHMLMLRGRLNTLQITFINWILYLLMLQNSYLGILTIALWIKLWKRTISTSPVPLVSTRQLTCFGAVPGASMSLALPPLGSADHKCVQACHSACAARGENHEWLDRGQYCLFAGVFWLHWLGNIWSNVYQF